MKQIKIIIKNSLTFILCKLIRPNSGGCIYKKIYFILTLNIIASVWAVTWDFLKVLSVCSPLEVKNVNVASILRNLLSLAWKIVWMFQSIRKRRFYISEKKYTKYVFNSRLKQIVLTLAVSTFFVAFSKTFVFIVYFE